MQAPHADTFERQPRRILRVIAVAGALVATIALSASVFAARGGGTTTPAWISLASVGGASLAAAGAPRVGDAVRFSTGYATTTKNPWVSVTCYQAGEMVYGQGGTPDADYVLGGASSQWLENGGGAATCRAELGDLYWRGGKQYYTYLAHTNFDAGE